MKRMQHSLAGWACLATLALTGRGLASDAETSATATGKRGRSGTAAATAHYVGDVGFARTDTRTGRINLARGVALGLDENGLSLSVSTAIAPRRGPAVATNFNVTIGKGGRSSHSLGAAVATGGSRRTVSVAGSTTTRRGGSSVSLASGKTSRGGIVRVKTYSRHQRPRHSVIRRSLRRR